MHLTTRIDHSRWERALKILLPMIDRFDSAHQVVEKRSFIDALEDYTLFDGSGSRFSGVNDKNFLFVHKEALISEDSVVLEGSGNIVIVSAGASLSNVKIHAEGKYGLVFLGNNVRIGKCGIRLRHRNNVFSVGDSTTWESGSASVMEDDMFVVIGRNCMFSTNIEMMTSDKHPIFDRTTGFRINKAASIIVEDNVWMGRSVRVGKGVCVARGGILGQGCLVTKPTMAYCAYAGVPARLLRENVEWRRSLKIKEIEPIA